MPFTLNNESSINDSSIKENSNLLSSLAGFSDTIFSDSGILVFTSLGPPSLQYPFNLNIPSLTAIGISASIPFTSNKDKFDTVSFPKITRNFIEANVESPSKGSGINNDIILSPSLTIPRDVTETG